MENHEQAPTKPPCPATEPTNPAEASSANADAAPALTASSAASPSAPASTPAGATTRPIREKVRDFPTGPGVYLFKDVQGRVIYIGKAKSLRARASTYFQKASEDDPRIADWIGDVADADYLEAESEVDALLLEARLIKDIQPRQNADLKDDKSFPYLQITTNEDYPRVNFTRSPNDHGVKLYGPFPRARSLRGAIQVLQQIFQFRTCNLDIDADDPKWKWFRPCLLHSIQQCTAPCNLRIERERYRDDIRRLKLFLDGKRQEVLDDLEAEMKAASKQMEFERAARLRDALKALRTLDQRGDLAKHAQPEVFLIDPRKGLRGLMKILKLSEPPRRIEGIDIAHLGGTETVGSLVTFIDGLPFKPGYRRYKIATVRGIDDFASIKEVVSRRVKGLLEREEPLPDLFLIDGGKGQLNAAHQALRQYDITIPTLISLAKREEEIYRLDQDQPLRLSRRSSALRLLQSVRDEAHRFAQHYHHLLRRKRHVGDEGP